MAQDGMEDLADDLRDPPGGPAPDGLAADGFGAAAGAGLLRRLLRRPAAPPDDSRVFSRALRQSMVRAAEQAAGLQLTVLGIAVEEIELDALLGAMEEGLLIVAVGPEVGSEPTGLVALDTETRAAVIEAQTLGQILPQPAEPRPPTRADCAMSEPLVAALLAQIEIEAANTPLAGWTLGQQPCGRLANPREVGLRLKSGTYRQVALTLDFGVGERHGTLKIVLPPVRSSVAEDRTEGRVADRWQPRLEAAVMRARTELTGVLHRLTMPIERAEGLRIGDLVALPGVSVASVRVEALDGRLVARARLGQMSGMRAVRIESPGAARMSDVPLVARADPGAVPQGAGRPDPLPAAVANASRSAASADVAPERAAAAGPGAQPALSAVPTEGQEPGRIGGAGVTVAHDLRPVETPRAIPSAATAPAARAGRRRSDGITVSPDAIERGTLDLSQEIDLAGRGARPDDPA